MGAAKTILAVVTREDTRDEIRAQLESAGHRFLAASTTDQAYALLQEHRKVDVLLADVMARGTFDATGLVDRARTLHPGLRMLVTTDLDRFARPANQDTGGAESPMIAILRTLLEDT